ncbi:alpha/beta hydrolase, partial [Streptomyces viridochromogenes]|uniref:alpha/beta hydrolase n=1 Tax=Streptomyces viridochromogenes TaxID=1938 RepID=UPI0006C371B7
DARALFDSLYKRAEAGELVLPGDPPQTVTPEDLQSLVFGNMYSPNDTWFEFAQALADLDATGPAAARSLDGRGEPTAFPYLPVMCQDYDFGVRSYATLARFERKLARLAPVTRLNPLAWTDLTGCQDWPSEVSNPQRRLRVDGTPPVLVTNSRYDVATPHSWGSNAARQIGREAVFLTYDGVGHGDYWLSP